MRKNDWLLLLAALGTGALIMLAMRFNAADAASTARVRFGGAVVAGLPLDSDGEYLWQRGEDYVRVAVADGCARVAASSCPDQTCVRMGTLCRAGAAVVCLPNRVSVTLEGASGAPDALDALVF